MISYVWICMLVFLFGVAWMILDDFGNHFLVQMKVVECLEKKKFVDGFDEVLGCLKFCRL